MAEYAATHSSVLGASSSILSLEKVYPVLLKTRAPVSVVFLVKREESTGLGNGRVDEGGEGCGVRRVFHRWLEAKRKRGVIRVRLCQSGV